MWLLPPDFPPDAFDLPPGAWMLPWYADDDHVAKLMDLLIRGERRIAEWFPLPWAVVEQGSEREVRSGAALVVRVPPSADAAEVLCVTRSLPWAYVFWRPPRPAMEGEAAWIERELKAGLLSELHRSTADPRHPLARFEVDRLPWEILAPMVGDPIELLEIAQDAILHRLQHAGDGLRAEDWTYSVRWSAGRRLADRLRRLRGPDQVSSLHLLTDERDEPWERDEHRRVGQALESIGLGMLIGEDLALGPLARSIADPVVEAAARDRLQLRRTIGQRWLPGLEQADPKAQVAVSPARPSPLPPVTRITTPSTELAPHHDSRRHHVIGLDAIAAKDSPRWAEAVMRLVWAMTKPRRSIELSDAIAILSTMTPHQPQPKYTRDLVLLLAQAFDGDTQTDLWRTRASTRALAQRLGTATEAWAADLDGLLIEKALLRSPDLTLLVQLEAEAGSRKPSSSTVPAWIDATWSSITAEIARLRGRSAQAVGLFDDASHDWAVHEFDGRSAWLQARVGAASAALEGAQLHRAERALDLVAREAQGEDGTIAAKVPLVRGLLAMAQQSLEPGPEHLAAAKARFDQLSDRRGSLFCSIALAECRARSGHPDPWAALPDVRDELGTLQDTRGRTYAELVLGDAALLTRRLDEARACYREARRLSEHTGDDLARSTAHHKLAHLEATVHRHAAALEHERQALALEREIELLPVIPQTKARVAELERLAAAEPAAD
ncbi:MAG: tetratricopeptide repeat protein [Myxococcales bacterium]|nr:tetratricopeptide repeat protein [Myxococcales bacterium]